MTETVRVPISEKKATFSPNPRAFSPEGDDERKKKCPVIPSIGIEPRVFSHETTEKSAEKGSARLQSTLLSIYLS